MTRSLIVLVGGVYLYIAVETAMRGNAGLSIMYFGYSVANVGAWLLAA